MEGPLRRRVYRHALTLPPWRPCAHTDFKFKDCGTSLSEQRGVFYLQPSDILCADGAGCWWLAGMGPSDSRDTIGRSYTAQSGMR